MHPAESMPPSSQSIQDVDPTPEVRGSKRNNSQAPPLKSAVDTLCPLTIVHICIGGVYFHDCPLQPLIPVFLVVMGVFLMVSALVSHFSAESCLWMTLDSLLSMFLFCWFICGNVWIYSIYPPNYNSNRNHNNTAYNQTTMGMGESYCHKSLYLYAFWTTTVIYIYLGLVMVPFLLLCCGAQVYVCVHCCSSCLRQERDVEVPV